MTNQELKELLLSPNGPEKAAKEEGTIPLVISMVRLMVREVREEEASLLSAALSYLVRMSKQKKPREEIMAAFSDANYHCLLEHDSPKVRKNAARLIGSLQVTSLDEPLIEALSRETVRMVRPSMILALGSLETDTVKEFLSGYQVKKAASPKEEKHQQEEEEALRTALSKMTDVQKHATIELPRGIKLELRCARGLEKVLADEIREKKAGRIVKQGRGRVLIGLLNPRLLYRLRVYQEVLIPLTVSKDAEKLGEELVRAAEKSIFSEERKRSSWGFRVEMKKDREQVKKVAKEIEAAAPWLLNSPSDYEIEFRIESLQGPYYLKLWNEKEDRFSYRQEAIPASIHPANAAGVVRLARKYMSTGEDRISVLDPCCGSGTLLYERWMLAKELGEAPPTLTGVDIEKRAIQAALKNGKALQESLSPADKKQLKLHLLQKDITVYEPKEKADELYANLPFGLRVGDHDTNLQLYPKLVKRLPDLIKPGGIAVLYTMEGKLLKHLISSNSQLKILEETKIEAGGLEPRVFIIRIQ